MAAASYSCPFPLICLFSLLLHLLIATATAGTITVRLTPLSTKHHPSPSSDPFKILNSLASSSLSRAHHLKSKTKIKTNSSNSLIKTPLSTHSYGAYSISLSFGTPPQTTSFIFDTGSSLVWFPCTSSYQCLNCNFPNIDPTQIPTYIPKLSSSSKLIDCQNPKCSWLFGPNVESRCKDCNPKNKTCTKNCPPYIIQYGLGSTAGVLLSESLRFPTKTVPDFLVGCSILSIRQPAGIAGFGRSSESLPSQMSLKKFSYCLLSRKFDDTPVSSNLILDTGSDSGDLKTPGLSYTPFYKNPVGSNFAYREYYYVGLRQIIVGTKHVKIPYSYLVPGSDGNVGTVVDSGSTFTVMEEPVFEAVAQEFIRQMDNYSRATDVENKAGLRPCFDISNKKRFLVPELVFKFKGGAKMTLPLENYFAIVGANVVCLIIVSDNSAGPQPGSGPAIILGDFQLQNFNVEFDLANDRFGFAKQKCA